MLCGGKKRGLTEGLGGHDLHGDHRGRGDGVVGVGLGVGVHAALKRVARLVEGGLGSGVHLGHELEDDHVANVGLDLGRGEHEAGVTTNNNVVGGLGTGAALSSGGRRRLVRRAFRDRHGLLLMYGRRLGRLATGVRPDYDHLGRLPAADGAVDPVRLLALAAVNDLMGRGLNHLVGGSLDDFVGGGLGDGRSRLLTSQVVIPLRSCVGVHVADGLGQSQGGNGERKSCRVLHLDCVLCLRTIPFNKKLRI